MSRWVACEEPERPIDGHACWHCGGCTGCAIKAVTELLADPDAQGASTALEMWVRWPDGWAAADSATAPVSGRPEQP